MKMDVEKLNQYVADGIILEFNSDKECMDWFNIYDFQNLKTIDELKELQGAYGFNIGEKRYHILQDFALEILEEDKKIRFTDDELYLLSDGMLALIKNTNKAIRMTSDSASVFALQAATEKYCELNRKIYGMLK